MARTIAIGDIHGCSVAFASLLAAIVPQREDTIITLGDYVDRGIACCYVQGRAGAREFRTRVAHVSQASKFREVVDRYFPR